MNLYAILGIPKEASDKEIKKAYHSQSKTFHPDSECGDEEKFKEINEAYEILSDPEKRKQYDEGGMGAVTSSQNALIKRVLAIFEEVIGFHGFVPEHSDLFSMMKANINEKELRMAKDVETFKNEIKNVETIQKRIKNSELLVEYMNNHIEDYTNRISGIEKELEYLSQVIDFIKDFDYDFDEDKDWDRKPLTYAGIDVDLEEDMNEY